MKLMIDLNVLLDYLQKRKPFYKFAAIVLSEILKDRVGGILPAHAITTIHYLIAKYSDRNRANEIIDWLLAKFVIAPLDADVFMEARELNFNDFEDSVVAILSSKANCRYIITRNVKDFKRSAIPAITPEEFISKHLAVS
jgi:predicted nucleic acid-binding protein